MFIVVSVINAFYLKIRSRPMIEEHPELQKGYDQLFKGELIYLNILWVVAGIGMIFGGFSDFSSFLKPSAGNLFILAFHVTVIILTSVRVMGAKK
jgi:hypothetical protein